jgi:hypothetical protein
MLYLVNYIYKYRMYDLSARFICKTHTFPVL